MHCWAYSGFDLLKWANGAMDKQTDGQTNQWMDVRTIEKELPHPANSICNLMHIDSKRIELESAGSSGFVKNSKLDQT